MDRFIEALCARFLAVAAGGDIVAELGLLKALFKPRHRLLWSTNNR